MMEENWQQVSHLKDADRQGKHDLVEEYCKEKNELDEGHGNEHYDSEESIWVEVCDSEDESCESECVEGCNFENENCESEYDSVAENCGKEQISNEENYNEACDAKGDMCYSGEEMCCSGEEMCYIEEEMGNTEEEMCDTEEEMGNTEEEMCDTEEEMGNTEEEMCDTEEEMGNTEEEMCDTEEEMGNTEEEMCDTEKEMGNTEEEMCNIEEEVSDSLSRAEKRDSEEEKRDSEEEKKGSGEENNDSGEENDLGEEENDLGEEINDSGEEINDSGEENNDPGEENRLREVEDWIRKMVEKRLNEHFLNEEKLSKQRASGERSWLEDLDFDEDLEERYRLEEEYYRKKCVSSGNFVVEHGLIFDFKFVAKKQCYLEILFVGDGDSGKTQLIESVFGDHPSLEVMSHDHQDEYRIHFPGRLLVHFLIRDLKNMEYVEKVDFTKYVVFCFCFDEDNPNSFENLEEIWVPEFLNRRLLTKFHYFLVSIKRGPKNKPEPAPGIDSVEQKINMRCKAKELCGQLKGCRLIECSTEVKRTMLRVFQSAFNSVYQTALF